MRLISVLIPTYNGENSINELLTKVHEQDLKNEFDLEIIIVDSSSTDNTIKIANNWGNIKVVVIENKSFDHGGTRNYLASHAKGDFLLYLTQDAMPYDENLIYNLARNFKDDTLAISYARQIPNKNAHPLEKFARNFNYPDFDVLKQKEDIKELGIKTFFNSNVCSMYKRTFFDQLGGFPEKLILNEDMVLASKAILNDYKVLYCSSAKVYHSHDYNLIQQFKRYFDIGMAFNQTLYLLEYASNEKEGIKMVGRMNRYLINEKRIDLIPYAFAQNLSKFIGYYLGKKHGLIPDFLKRKLSAYMK